MVEFKSWRDSYLFLKNYGNFTCLNCKHSNHNLDTNVEHTDSEYVHLFCTEWISMVRLDFQFVCSRWKDRENGKGLKDYGEGCDMWNLSDGVLNIIEDKRNGKWSIEEIEELINEEETIKQES